MTDVFHVLITRFSIRMSPDKGFRDKSTEWLFDESRLEHKLALFETVTFPSIIFGKRKPDLYLILVDEELPFRIKEKLEAVISKHPWVQTFTVPGQGLVNMRNIQWIKESFKISTPFVLTTNIDDDDALGNGYVENLQLRVNEHINDHANDAFHWFGSMDMYEWDMIFDTDEPLGFVKPFSGGVKFVLSTGFSVLTKNHNHGPSVFFLSHSKCLDYLTKKHRRFNYDRVGRFKFRLRLLQRASQMRVFSTIWKVLLGTELAARLDYNNNGSFEGLIINHGDNLQQIRLGLGKINRTPVDEMDFQNKFNINVHATVSRVNKDLK